MASNRRSLKTKIMALNKWTIAGATLGIIAGMTTKEPWSVMFPQWGIPLKVLQIAILGSLGIQITIWCKPTRRALVGAVTTVTLAIAAISLGALGGILAGTAWRGALVGTGIVVALITPVALSRGTVGWGGVFIPLGAIGGAIAQLALSNLRREWRIEKSSKIKQEIPEWLQGLQGMGDETTGEDDKELKGSKGL